MTITDLIYIKCVIGDSSLKNVNSQSDSNNYRNAQNISQLDSSPSIVEPNQEPVNPNVMGHSPNISSRLIADVIIPRVCYNCHGDN